MKRKLLALTLALAGTMTLSTSVPALAATGTAEDTTGNTVTGEGDVSYVDTTVYSVTLPTTETTKLVVDPQGLTGLTNGSVATADELESYAGKITCASTPIVTNLSSVPMKVSATMKLTGNATAVKTTDAVNDATTKANNILLYAVPSASDTKGIESNYTASTTGIVLSTTDATVDFILPAAEYNYKKDADGKVTYEVVDGETGHGSGLSFAGYVNKHADWSDYIKAESPKTIGMTAVFTFTKTIADGEAADTTDGAPYGMKAYTGDKVAVTPANAAPSIATKSYTLTAGTDVEISVNLGAGEKIATGVKSVTWLGAEMLNVADMALYSDGKITISGSTVDVFLSDESYTPATLVVTFDDANSTQVQVVLQK